MMLIMLIGMTAVFFSIRRTDAGIRSQQAALLENEERIRAITNSANEAIIMMDNNGNISYWNPAAHRILGYTREEAIGKNLHELIAPERFRPAHLAAFPEFQKTGQGNAIGKTLELAARRKDGQEIDIELSLSAVKIKGEWHSVGIIQDITERKQSEEILKLSEEKYRTIIENIEDGYVELDLKGKFIFFNDALCKIQGYPKDELMKLAYRDIMDKENAQKIYKEYNKVFTTGQSEKEVEYEVITKSGERKFLETSITPIKDASGHVVAFRGIVRDKTERKQAEDQKEAMLDALRESEEKYRTILENMQESYYELDLAGNLTFVNDAVCRNMGYSKDELIGMNYRQYTEKEELQRVFQVYSKVYTTGEPLNEFGWRIIRKDGTKMYIEGSVALKKDSEGKIIGFKGLHHDITERKQAELLLRESDERYKALFDRSLDLVYLYDFEGRFIDANDAALNRLGYTREEIPSLNFASLLSEDQLPLAFKTLQEIQENGIQKELG